MEWIKKHADAVIVLTGILAAVCWMNTKFVDVNEKFNSIERKLIRIETVLLVKGIMPEILASKNEEFPIYGEPVPDYRFK